MSGLKTWPQSLVVTSDIFPGRNGVKVVVRIIPTTQGGLTQRDS